MQWLKTFCALVETGHFTHTAEKLFMTQSGVSQHIKKLETQLDSALLIREGKQFSLTEAGERLYQQGQVLLQSTADLTQSIKLDEPFQGRISIASPGSIGLKLYPYLLSLQQTHRTLIFDHVFAPNEQIISDILARKLDLGLVTKAVNDARLTAKELTQEPLVLVTQAKIKEIDWQQLLTLGFIGHPDGEYHANQLLSKNFVEFEHINQFDHHGYSNQIGLILQPVSLGLGFTVLPLNAAQAFNAQENITIHYLPNKVSETVYLCQHKQAYQSKRILRFKGLLSEFVEQ